MPPTEEPDPRPEHAPTVHAARAPELSTPTFPSDAESLLNHIKLGAARAPARAAGAFPVIPNYEIESELGRGGMGVVYKAKHAGLRHAVAIKMILSAARASAGEVARFLAEAEAIALVKHPNVVQVFDLGEADGRPYFVMEYVAGGTLADLLKAGRLDPARAAVLVEAVARGVQAAHEQDIVHRDLKPGNVLLQIEDFRLKIEDEGVASQSSITNLQSVIPKVSDFGLAKRLASDLTRSQAVMGTPQYMAPEQAGGKAKFVGPGADVYALGTILYECLTGSLPFATEGDAWSLIHQVLEVAPEPPRKRVPGVPRDLEPPISQMTFDFRHGMCAGTLGFPAFLPLSCRNDRGTQWVTAEMTPCVWISTARSSWSSTARP
ncbi:MAG: serine/threonine protein kinase, partial [Planctomycetes bacterium]|nr:serine/threonine protein kinase [Planctomycetota bacterium]